LYIGWQIQPLFKQADASLMDSKAKWPIVVLEVGISETTKSSTMMQSDGWKIVMVKLNL
jgi:hypothetical protein